MPAADADKVLLFRIGGILYGADMGRVVKLVSGNILTSVPRTPANVKGVIFHEGKVVPVFLYNASGTAESENLILLLEHRDGPMGLVLDKIIGIAQKSEMTSDNNDVVKYRGEPIYMITPENLVSPPIPDKYK